VKHYRTDDHRLIEAPPDRVWKLLTDLEGYNAWWPRAVRFRIVQLVPSLIGAKIEARLQRRSIFAEIAHVDPGRKVHWALRAAPYQGEASWILEPEEEDTRLRLRIEAPIHPALIGEHFLNAKDFAKKLGQFTSRLFEGLQRRLQDAVLS
jgi:uncharacterized protein YndB with AHSA1/START domain